MDAPLGDNKLRLVDNANAARRSGSELVELIKNLAFPSSFILKYNDVVIRSTLYSDDPETQIKNIVQEFNQTRKSIMTKSFVGERTNPDKFRIVALNNQPELVPPSKYKYRKSIYLNPNDKTEEMGTHHQTKLFFGAYGHYVINVPVGKVALAWKGNTPIVLGQGPHVIHDANLREIKEENLVDANSGYISHGTIHIIRVQPNYVCLIWIKYEPYILPPREEPYVFNEAVFTKEKDLVPLTSGYINHSKYHILQIPDGKVATVWFGAEPKILESRPDPYIINDQTFRLEKKSANETFESATAGIIQHGAIKRIMPKTGEVAITYNNGKLVTYDPPSDHNPIIITNPNHSFEGFLAINIQTMEFPSDATKSSRKKDAKSAAKNADPSDDMNLNDINYETFRTADGLPIGVKILVVYEIDKPTVTLTRLKFDQIIPHIERLVVADMGRTIQSASSVDFLSSDQTKIKQPNKNGDSIDSYQSEFFQNLQDKVKCQLQSDFAEYGIKLVRLNFETPKILDHTISGKMAQFSLMSTEARAQEGVLDRNFKIAQTKAQQDAETMKIKQKQENDNRVLMAEAEQKSVEFKAQAELNAARLRAQARLAEVEAEAMGQQKLLEIAQKRAELYDKHPGLLQYDMAKVQADAMRSINSTIISPEIAQGLYGLNLLGRNINMSVPEIKHVK
jgi:regulator of protease activity HflC (stomatin/prohibitin superfamily)